MPYDEISLKVREIVARLFERDAATLSDETLLMQDLPCESIDLLEVSVQLGATFHIFVDEERAFLRSLRYQLAGAPDAAAFLPDADGMALQSPLTLGDIARWVEQALDATRQGA